MFPSRSFLILIHWTRGWGRSLVLPVFELIEWCLVVLFDHFIGFVSERSMTMYGICNGLMPKGRLILFPALLRDGFKPFKDLMLFSKVGLLVKHSSPGAWHSSIDKSFSTQMRSPATCAVHGLWNRGTGAKRICFCLFCWFLHIFSLFLMWGEREKVQMRFLITLHTFWICLRLFLFLLLYLPLQLIIWSSCSWCQTPPLPYHLWEFVTLGWGDHRLVRHSDELWSPTASESFFNGRRDGGASCRTFLKISLTKISLVTHWLLLEPPLFHLLDDLCAC